MPERSAPADDRAYYAYLVRARRLCGNTAWQITARDIETGDEFPFPNVESLLEFLAGQLTNCHSDSQAR